MASEYATGAVHIYVKMPATIPVVGGSIKYLGTAEQGPERSTERTFKQVMNDLSSQRAFDYVYAGGEEAVLSFVLTRWNENVAQGLERAPVSGGFGFATIFDQGSLMGQENLAVEIWYGFSFHMGLAGAPARPSMPGIEGGRHYVQALFWGPERDETGSHERKKHMVFRAWKKYDKTTSPPRFTLFDTNMAGLPTPD